MTANKLPVMGADVGHTPGPWTIEPYRNTGYATGSTWIYGAKDEHIATVHVDCDATDADARLIAAAPEMRDELDGVQAMLDEIASELADLGHRYAETCADKAMRIRALLARIDGESR